MSNSVLGSMRLSWNASASFGRYASSSTGGAGRQLPPTEPGSLERRMVESYRGQTGGTIAFGTGQDDRHLVLRGGEAGLLNLNSFRTILSPPGGGISGTPQSGTIEGGTAPNQPQATLQDLSRTLPPDPSTLGGTMQGGDVPPDPEQPVHMHLVAVDVTLRDALARWRDAASARERQDGRLINRFFTTPAAREASRLEMATRSDALRLAGEALRRLDGLAGQLPEGELKNAVGRERESAMRSLLAVSLGGPFDSNRLPPDVTRAVDEAVGTLLELHDRMRGTGAGDYGADKLVAALSQFGAIASLGASGDAAKLQMAAEGLGAVAGAVLETLEPPRDGAALNALSGLSPELDGAVKALRIEATTNLLAHAHQIRNNGNDPDPQERARLGIVATKLVTDEMALAEPRRQLGRVLEKAGVPLSGAALQGVRIDGHLIDTIRRKLGPDTQAAGLILASLLIAERGVREGDAANELRAALETLRLQTANDPQLDGTARGRQLRALDERIRSLGDENAPLKQLAENAAANLRDAHRELEQIKREVERLETSKVEQTRQAKLLGGRTIGLIEIEEQLSELDDRRGELTEKLPLLERAAAKTKQDHEARVVNRTQRRDQLAYLSDREIELLGLKGVSSLSPGSVREAATKLVRRGLASAQQAHDLAASVNRVMAKIDINARGRTGMIGTQERNLVTGRVQDEARRLQDRLFLGITGEVESFQHRPGELTSKLQSAVLEKGLAPVNDDDLDTLPIALLGGRRDLGERRQRLGDQVQQYDQAKLELLQQIGAGEQPTAAETIYRVLDARREIMGAETHDALRDLMRAAVLAVMQATRSPVGEFDPAQHADAIRGKLREWGVDVATFRPEIDLMLSHSFGETELALWIADRPDRPDAPMPLGGTRLALRGDSAGASLLRSFDDLSNGSKIRLTSTGGVEVTTGKIPLEPTGTASLTLTGGIDSVGMFEIAQGSDGIDIVLIDGLQGKGGASVSASLMGHIDEGAKKLGLAAGVSAGVEVGGASLRGVALRFENSTEGREAARRMLEALVSGRQFAPVDLAVAEIRPVVERSLSGKVNVQAQFGWEPKQVVLGHEFKASASLRGGVGYSGGSKQSVTENLNQRVIKTDTTHTIDLSGSFKVGVQGNIIGTPWTDDGTGKTKDWAGSMDLLDVGGQAVLWTTVTKAKLVQSAGGRVDKSTDLQRVTQVRGGDGLRGFDIVGGPLFGKLMNPPMDGTVDRDTLDRLARLREAITEMAGLAGRGDQIVVGFGLREGARERINVMMERANALREGRVFAPSREDAMREANRLQEEALALVNDEDNYIPKKLMVLAASDMRASLTPLNLVFVKVSEGIEDKREGYTAELALPEDLVLAFDRGPGNLRPELPPEIDPQALHGLIVGSVRMSGDGDVPGGIFPGEQPETIEGSNPLDQKPRVEGPGMFAMYQRDNECGVCAINAVLGEEVVDEPQLLLTAVGLDRNTTESAKSGFELMTVATHLARLQTGGDHRAGDGKVMMVEAKTRDGAWHVPELPDETERLVVFQQTREDQRVHRHFVAFRKDSDGAWWLLDSRNPGKGEPLREKITPQEYVNRLGDQLENFTLIGSGIDGVEVPANL